MKNWIFTLIIVALGIVIVLAWFMRSGRTDKTNSGAGSVLSGVEYNFPEMAKAENFQSSTPEHAAVLDTLPNEVGIAFTTGLMDNSTLSITKDGKEYGNGATMLEGTMFMRRALVKELQAGVYEVRYTACFTDKTCSEGSFAFGIEGGAAMKEKTKPPENIDL